MNIQKYVRLVVLSLLAILCFLLIAFFLPRLSAESSMVGGKYYFVSPEGADKNNGLSPATAWKTLAKVNSTALKPGNRIMFQGGQHFSGSLSIEEPGLADHPITFMSYGQGSATVDSGGEIGAVISASYIHVKNLKFVGRSSTNSSHYGIHLKNESSSQIQGIELDRLEVSGYGEHGILAETQEGSDYGFSGLKMTNIISHENRGDGIRVKGSWNVQEKKYSHSNLYIGDCQVYNNSGYDTENSSGNGVVISDVDGAIIEYCEAYNNGYGWGGKGGGPVGIWSWDSNNVTVQYSEAHHNKNGAGRYDGGGFDIDGGDTNSIIQYCYSHDNEGPGYFLAHFAQSSETNNNIIRYNISENDAQRTVQGALNFWSGDAGELTDNWVYNNVIYGNEKTTAVVMRESSGSNNRVLNNIFIVSQGATLLRSENTSDIFYENNVYWGSGEPVKIVWGREVYRGSVDWSLVSAQELRDERSTGLDVNPKLVNPGHGQTIGDPHRLIKLEAYKLRLDSPLIDSALNLQTVLNHDPGEQDFYSNTMPQGTQYDIGSHEFRLIH